MSMMLDKCAVAGDITQGIDRTGCWTCAITVIGGSSSTAVKLVASDTVAGVYSDFKELVPAASADKDQYKGFVVDLHGAKKFIKVTGAVMATAVFGDCDHDVKAIAITEGEVPSVADLEDNKAATIDASTYTSPVEVTPSEGKDGMKKATITLSNIPSSFFDTITLTIDNPIYSKTLTKGATVYMNNKYINMLVGRGDVTETITSIGKVFATVTYVDSTQVLTIILNTSHPEASEGAPFKVWGE